MDSAQERERLQGVELDDLLHRWHTWAKGEQAARGFGNTSAGMGNWRCSRQYDSDNGALDGELEKSTMQVVEFQVSEMVDPYRAAIHTYARNLTVGRSVFRSPRLPADPIEAERITKMARNILIERLTTAGVM